MSLDRADKSSIYLSLGSNIEPEVNIIKAIRMLRKLFTITAISNIWESPPFEAHGPPFLNTSVKIETSLSPEDLKECILRQIEDHFGRVRTDDKNAPRPIDLDIILIGSELIDPDIWERAHLAVPLAELIPDYLNLATGKTLNEVAAGLQETHRILPRLDLIDKI